MANGWVYNNRFSLRKIEKINFWHFKLELENLWFSINDEHHEKWLWWQLRGFRMVFNFFLFRLSLSVQKKLKNSIYEIPIFPFTLNINNKRTTSAQLISWVSLESLLNMWWWRQCLLLAISRYYCLLVSRYYDPLSRRRKRNV